jgi:hypothetical protein
VDLHCLNTGEGSSIAPLSPPLTLLILAPFKVKVPEGVENKLHHTIYHTMSADQSQQQFAGPDNNTQAALLVPATITLVVSLLLYGIHIRARRSSPLVYTDGMITAALVSEHKSPAATEQCILIHTDTSHSGLYLHCHQLSLRTR